MAFCICESAPDGAEDKRMTYTMREVTKRAGVSPAIQLGRATLDSGLLLEYPRVTCLQCSPNSLFK